MTKLEFIRRAVSMNTEHIKALAEQQLVLIHTLAEFERGATEKREWQGLTDGEVEEIYYSLHGAGTEHENLIEMVKATEAKLKEKNG